MVEENEPLDPVDVGLFRLIAVVSNTEDVTNLAGGFAGWRDAGQPVER